MWVIKLISKVITELFLNRTLIKPTTCNLKRFTPEANKHKKQKLNAVLPALSFSCVIYVTDPRLGGPLDAGLWEYKLELGLRYAVPIPAMLTPPEGVRGWAVPVPPLETTEFRDSERCKPTATKFKLYIQIKTSNTANINPCC